MFSWWKRGVRRAMSFERTYKPRLEGLELRELPAVTLQPGPVVNVSQANGNQREQSIVVNPLNTNQVVAFSNIEDIDGNNTADAGLFSAWSNDGGRTWNGQFLFTNTALPEAACCDPQAVWDTFGNIWMTYLTDSFNVAVALSTDAGRTFTPIILTTTNNADQPSIAIGPGSKPGTQAVWVTYDQGVPAPNRQEVQGILVTGKGLFGFFGNPTGAPGSELVNGQFGDIAVGPRGEVAVTYQSLGFPFAGPSAIYVNVDPDGFGPKPLGNRIFVTNTNVGGARIIPGTSNNFGIDAEVNLAWDNSNGPHRGRLYMVYVDAADTVTNDTDVVIRFSDDRGKTWSGPRVVHEVTTGSQFNPAIAVDPYTGMVGVAWYDTRNDPSGIQAEFFATASDNGGKSFAKSVVVSAGPSTSILAEVPPVTGVRPLGFGDYNKIDFVKGIMQLIWADNSPQLPNKVDGNRMELAAARVRVNSTPSIGPNSQTIGRVVTTTFSSKFKLLSVAGSVYEGRVRITNTSGTILRGPLRVQIQLPHTSMQLRSPRATRKGDTYIFTLSRTLLPGESVTFKTLIFNPLKLRIGPTTTEGWATPIR